MPGLLKTRRLSLSLSPAALQRALWPALVSLTLDAWREPRALRVPLEHFGARIYSDLFSLARAHNAFDGDGRSSEPQLQEPFETNIRNFIDTAEANKHYRAWSAPGSSTWARQPEPAINRVEITPV